MSIGSKFCRCSWGLKSIVATIPDHVAFDFFRQIASIRGIHHGELDNARFIGAVIAGLSGQLRVGTCFLFLATAYEACQEQTGRKFHSKLCVCAHLELSKVRM
jgi:hypothetical protein